MNELKKALDKLNDLKHKVQDGEITQVDLVKEISDIEGILDSEFSFQNSKNVEHYESLYEARYVKRVKDIKEMGELAPTFYLLVIDGDLVIQYSFNDEKITLENCKEFVKA